jgi:hypothetical protein
VLAVLPGIAYLIEINIECDAPQTARARAVRLARKLAQSARGVVVDPQDGTVQTPRGIKRVDLSGPESEEPGELLTISWWFENAEAFASGGLARVLDAMERHAPEALPRRYGLWEPPQFKFAEQGRAHLESFLLQHFREPTVWYPSKPFSDVYLSAPPQVGPSPQGYRCCLLELHANARVLGAAGWPMALRRLWLEVASALRPFFAEIRRGESPIRSWFWTGIPRELGLAALIGPPYTNLWPQFVAQAKELSDGMYASDVIDSGGTLSLAPPKEIAQPPQPSSLTQPVGFSLATLRSLLKRPIVAYPKTWPFAPPFG